ncbi:hypothetical protein [Rathayibacter tanaceti]|uniref:Uncharacterized protein n=1 Tax=Rathayibacter tanaceti TaxID=1671680 RepID=A0A162FY25_9MICO|nr:hypothetical protein [Rathayibacter tanaceti]KZX21230.1 hypothetical protein ACH61_01645 [Rathayibacter tanaceti]QHC56817.1 hypothetical protein GSU10_15055 [Rathayibacter tanaceti]
MKGNELAWRTLADQALEGRRRWNNVGDIASDAGAPTSTASLALERLESIGAITRYRRGGRGFAEQQAERLPTLTRTTDISAPGAGCAAPTTAGSVSSTSA